MFALFGVVLGIAVICAACVSVRTPPKHYSTCRVFKVQPVRDVGQKLWISKCVDAEGIATWIVFHSEVKEGWVVEYTPFVEEGDTLTHGSVHAIFSLDERKGFE